MHNHEYTSLIKEEAMFLRTIKNAFTGQAKEVVGELLQNSQRAHATRVDVTFPHPCWCIYTDNGHGLVNGIETLYALLRLGDSDYEDPTVDMNQYPMGVGLYALFCREGIESIRISSGAVSLWLQTHMWIHDPDYRRSWSTRIKFLLDAIPGFHLVIGGTPESLAKLRNALTITVPEHYDPQNAYPIGAGQGYADLLTIFLDGRGVQTALPAWLTLPDANILTEYQGNKLRIAFFRTGPSGLTTNWYGQIVADQAPRGEKPYQAYLEVRSGQPVHPLSPSRQGLIQDSSLTDLYRFIEDAIFTGIQAMVKPTALHIKLLYKLNRSRAQQECPFLLVRRHWALRDPGAINCYGDLSAKERMRPLVVVHRDKLSRLLLLRNEVIVQLSDRQASQTQSAQQLPEQALDWQEETFQYGLCSFLAATNLTVFYAVEGIDLPDGIEQSLWWKPGVFNEGVGYEYHTQEVGGWGIGTGETPPDQWTPLPHDASVFVFNEAVSWSIGDSEALIGTRDMVHFLHFYAQVLWTPDDGAWDTCEESYNTSLDELALSYLPNTLLRTAAVGDLPHLLQKIFATHVSHPTGVRSIEFVYTNTNKQITALVVHFADGGTEQVALYPSD